MDRVNPHTHNTLFWDADCGFCRRWVDRWKHATGDSVAFCPLQEAPAHIQLLAGNVPYQRIVLRLADGSTCTGARAAIAALASTSFVARALLAIIKFPPFSSLAEFAYSFVAAHRSFFSFLTTLLWGSGPLASTYKVSGWLFPRLMGVVFLCAFVSLGVQIQGLSGSDGILPISSYLDHVAHALALSPSSFPVWLQIPSLFWLDSSDSIIFAVLALGVLASLMLVVGRLPIFAAFIAWLCYLSFASAIPLFLDFQWDALLLESGFLLFLYIPWRRKALLSGDSTPSKLGRLFVWWLLFRLMFESGVVKLHGYDASGVNAWLDGSALSFHYFTQPLPVWTSWWAARLPLWFQKLSVFCVFVVELLVPFFIFGPRRLRITAFWSICALMLLIMSTGNFGFFNVLTIVLALSLVDDSFWNHRICRRFKPSLRSPSLPALQRIFLPPVAALIFILTISSLLSTLRLPLSSPLVSLNRFFAPFRSSNSYGLFSVMTTERPEITIEASSDAIHWVPYIFRWKMSSNKSSMPFIVPHMPRLDWQMWFAALEFRRSGNPPDWLMALLSRLEQGSPDVLALFSTTPDFKPKYFRLRLDLLTFASPHTHASTRQYWISHPLPQYSIQGELQKY